MPLSHHTILHLLWVLSLGVLIIIPVVSYAQDDAPPPSGPSILVTGVDVNGEGFPLVVVNLGNGETRTLATFASRAACLPTVFPDASAVLYEVANTESPVTVYQVDTNSGERQTLDLGNIIARLDCPIVAPNGQAIAWVSVPPSPEELTALTITDTAVTNSQVLAQHERIYDVIWSPTSSLLIYTATSEASPYPTLYSMARSNQLEPYEFWRREQGLIMDYEWSGDETSLVIAYALDTFTAIAKFPVACIVGLDVDCEPVPIASFPPDAKIELLHAYSPINDDVVVSVQFPDPTVGFPKADLWIVDFDGIEESRQLTFAPALLKTGASWSIDGSEIFFIGSQFDTERQVMRGQIYSVTVQGEPEITLRFASDIFSPATILWQYE